MADILIFGNTYLSAKCCEALSCAGHYLLGYVPNVNPPTVPGKMPIPKAGDWVILCGEFDFVLSIQYDERILLTSPAYNVHTGLLPEWGGMDILYHTLRLGAREQGLTFHRVTPTFDEGPILSKMTYPVLPGDTIVDLYERLATIAPGFTVAAVDLLLAIGQDRAMGCQRCRPNMFRRGHINREDLHEYYRTPTILRRHFR